MEKTLGVPCPGLVPHACAVSACEACLLGDGAAAAAIQASGNGTCLVQHRIGVPSVVSDLSSSPPASQSIPTTLQSGHRLGSRNHWPSQRRLKDWGSERERALLCSCGEVLLSCTSPPETDAGATASLGLSLLSHLCWGLVPLLEPIWVAKLGFPLRFCR